MAFTILLLHLVVMATARAVVNVRDSYSYSYSVNAEETGDFKSHQETRSGGLVRGSYSVLEPGGILRTVEYTADPVRGFQAVVHRRALPTGNATTTSRTPSTQRLLTVRRLPSTFGGSRPTSERLPSTTERSLPTTQRSASTVERSSSTSGSLLTSMSTHAPDNLGHFAAAMFGTRRKKLLRRQPQ